MSLRIVILGRPNVGKSTLFNRLVRKRQALVHDLPGVTRDRIEKQVSWWVGGKEIQVLLTDTGGLGGERFTQEIDEQVEFALEGADVALLVFDSQTGLTSADEEIVSRLEKVGLTQKIPVLGVVNKVDDEKHEERIADFFALGLAEILTVSSEHGRGIDDLQEKIIELLPNREEHEKIIEEELPKIAIVGRPNVGKSTLVNSLLQENRMITSSIAGTTVDAVDSFAELNGHKFQLIDTAGIRRKGKTEQGVEVLSVVQAKKALERADIAILVLDGEAGIMDQDEKIGGLIEEAGCAVILAVNKWDMHRNNPKFTQELAAERIRKTMGYLKYAPIVFTSAKFGKGFENLGDLIEEILHQRKLKVPTHEFTEWVRDESVIHNPQNAKFYLCHQSGRNPPTFVCHVNDPDKIHFSLKRHLLNALRDRWGFMGSPVRLHFMRGASDRKAPRKSPGKKHVS